MKHISILVKPASGLCNMKCRYCFYADITSLRQVKSYGLMKEDVMKRMIDQLFVDLDDGDQLTIAFQGGEPTLIGLRFYQKLVAYVNDWTDQVDVTVHYAIQTNGTLIDETWATFLRQHQFLVGLSIDGTPFYHDLYRVDWNGCGTYDRVHRAKKLFDQFNVAYNILCVLTHPLAQNPEGVFRFIKEEKIQYIQFIPCLSSLSTDDRTQYDLTPIMFASFYQTLFTLWFDELKQGHYYSIKLFDDLYNLLVRRMVTACGLTGQCQTQHVIEADGSVYPCDFYVLDEYRMGNIQDQTLRELFSQKVTFKFLTQRPAPEAFCLSCSFQSICCGGCKRMKDAMYISSDGNYCGYQQVLSLFIDHLDEIIYLVNLLNVN